MGRQRERGGEKASRSLKGDFGILSMRGAGAAVRSERAGESGEGGRGSPSLAGALGSLGVGGVW